MRIGEGLDICGDEFILKDFNNKIGEMKRQLDDILIFDVFWMS